jgi:hypothetical protein
LPYFLFLSGKRNIIRQLKNSLKILKTNIMEKFMLIFQGGQMKGASPEQMQAHMGKWMAWIEKLSKTDQYVAGEPLLPGGKLISGPGGKTVTDGPYTEGKEVVGGFFIINAKDMNEAVSISKDCPDFELGSSVQIRQVMKM